MKKVKNACLGGLVAASLFCAPAWAEMQVSSHDMTDGNALPMAHVFNNFGCKGENISPHLAWSGAPEETKSYAVTVYDPDAPTGSGWWHWVAFNIPANVTELKTGASANAMPQDAVESLSDYGFTHFGGACPPPGDAPHRYIFKVHALDTPSLPLDEKATGAMVGYYLTQHRLDSAKMTLTYGRGVQ